MTAQVLHADNIDGMGDLVSSGRRFALAYLDPPFFTQESHYTTTEELAFEDRWANIDAFVATITNAVHTAWTLLIPEGSVVLHVDSKTSHYLKVSIDKAIGRRCFASEIVWRYRRWPAPTRNFQRVHDVLLRYVRDPDAEPRWNQIYEPLSPKTIETWGTRKQKAVWQKGDGHAVKETPPRRKASSATAEQSPGVPLGDVWDDIGIIGPASDERNGYPTQKPEKLLQRLILALTNEGDHVLDPYCGSGTTLAVAHRLGRHAVGIDSSEVAVRFARERLAPLLAQGQLFAATPEWCP